MKALSVMQPWATMIAQGLKTIEIRSWKTKYRGPILICSSKKPSIWHPNPNLSYPCGVAVAVVELYDIAPMQEADVKASGYVPFNPAMYSWKLRYPIKITPFPVKGKLSLFEVAYELPKKEAGLAEG